MTKPQTGADSRQLRAMLAEIESVLETDSRRGTLPLPMLQDMRGRAAEIRALLSSDK